MNIYIHTFHFISLHYTTYMHMNMYNCINLMKSQFSSIFPVVANI